MTMKLTTRVVRQRLEELAKSAGTRLRFARILAVIFVIFAVASVTVSFSFGQYIAGAAASASLVAVTVALLRHANHLNHDILAIRYRVQMLKELDASLKDEPSDPQHVLEFTEKILAVLSGDAFGEAQSSSLETAIEQTAGQN